MWSNSNEIKIHDTPTPRGGYIRGYVAKWKGHTETMEGTSRKTYWTWRIDIK